MAHVNIVGCRSGFWHEGFGDVGEGPSCCRAGEGERDRVGARGRVGFCCVGGMGCRRRSVSPVDGMRVREVLVHTHGLPWNGDLYRELDRGFVEDRIDHVARHRSSAHAITDDTRSGGVAGEGEGRSRLSSRTVIEAVVVEFRAARSRKGQRDGATGWKGWHFGKGKDAERTWRHEPVIVHEAAVRLVIGEGRAVGVGRGGAVDDERDAAVEGGGRVEGVLEVVGQARSSGIESGSFEAGWEIDEGSVLVEGEEE